MRVLAAPQLVRAAQEALQRAQRPAPRGPDREHAQDEAATEQRDHRPADDLLAARAHVATARNVQHHGRLAVDVGQLAIAGDELLARLGHEVEVARGERLARRELLFLHRRLERAREAELEEGQALETVDPGVVDSPGGDEAARYRALRAVALVDRSRAHAVGPAREGQEAREGFAGPQQSARGDVRQEFARARLERIALGVHLRGVDERAVVALDDEEVGVLLLGHRGQVDVRVEEGLLAVGEELRHVVPLGPVRPGVAVLLHAALHDRAQVRDLARGFLVLGLRQLVHHEAVDDPERRAHEGRDREDHEDERLAAQAHARPPRTGGTGDMCRPNRRSRVHILRRRGPEPESPSVAGLGEPGRVLYPRPPNRRSP